MIYNSIVRSIFAQFWNMSHYTDCIYVIPIPYTSAWQNFICRKHVIIVNDLNRVKYR